TPGSIATALAECHRLAGPRLVIEAGCEIPRGTPERNLHVLREYARGHKP
ncbi:MAG: Methylcobalamin:coenzyme methyltransferase, methylamine-specific, partial [Candidatus Aminicenantes bacterium]|nr:Methylcobalamin:coenzyme methyltransferase, methylamine-specific [Candidatus Aminicenantes bacterium]